MQCISYFYAKINILYFADINHKFAFWFIYTSMHLNNVYFTRMPHFYEFFFFLYHFRYPSHPRPLLSVSPPKITSKTIGDLLKTMPSSSYTDMSPGTPTSPLTPALPDSFWPHIRTLTIHICSTTGEIALYNGIV